MIVSFYTPSYAGDAFGLKESVEAQGHDITIVPVEELGTWEANCAQKARVCRDALRGHEQILFLDADARAKGPLNALLDPHEGIRLDIVKRLNPGWFAQRYHYKVNRYGAMWNSGILSIRRSPEVMALMDAWVDMCGRHPKEWDQFSLQWAHREIESPVKVEALPKDLCVGGLIGHRSAFHRKWRKAGDKPIRQILLVGSGSYIADWWAENRERYRGFSVVAMNNACAVVGDDCDLWLIPDDYSGENRAADYIPSNAGGYPRATNRQGNWITKPLWIGQPTTMMISALCHLLNEARLDNCRLEVHLAGCDMIYEGDKTHFYGKGGLDPLRYTDGQLEVAQRQLIEAYRRKKSTIFNAGGQDSTRLIFDRV